MQMRGVGMIAALAVLLVAAGIWEAGDGKARGSPCMIAWAARRHSGGG